MGEFVWVAFDYLGEDGVWPKRGWNAGLIDMAGNPYPEYYLRKSMWSKEPVVHIAIETSAKRESEWHPRKAAAHWNHKWNGNYLLPLYIYSNCDEVELRINDSLIGRKAVDKNLYYVRWELPFSAGKVQAIGYRNNKKVTEHTLRTAGTATALSIVASKTELVADNEDVLRFDLTVVDKNRVVVQDAAHEIKVELSGPARLLGLDNGNQSDVTPFSAKARKAFEGRLLVTIQATGEKGLVKMNVTSPGLQPAVYTIKSVSSKN
jgi:beta-galactosidase